MGGHWALWVQYREAELNSPESSTHTATGKTKSTFPCLLQRGYPLLSLSHPCQVLVTPLPLTKCISVREETTTQNSTFKGWDPRQTQLLGSWDPVRWSTRNSAVRNVLSARLGTASDIGLQQTTSWEALDLYNNWWASDDIGADNIGAGAPHSAYPETDCTRHNKLLSKPHIFLFFNFFFPFFFPILYFSSFLIFSPF